MSAFQLKRHAFWKYQAAVVYVIIAIGGFIKLGTISSVWAVISIFSSNDVGIRCFRRSPEALFMTWQLIVITNTGDYSILKMCVIKTYILEFVDHPVSNSLDVLSKDSNPFSSFPYCHTLPTGVRHRSVLWMCTDLVMPRTGDIAWFQNPRLVYQDLQHFLKATIVEYLRPPSACLFCLSEHQTLFHVLSFLSQLFAVSRHEVECLGWNRSFVCKKRVAWILQAEYRV